MLVRGNLLWVAENTGSVLVIDLNVCHLDFTVQAMGLTITRLDERDDFHV
jgi:hypothetical protein